MSLYDDWVAEKQQASQVNSYDTKLSPQDESKYQSWLKSNVAKYGQDRLGTSDYDLRGFWKNGDSQQVNDFVAGRGHAPDTWKKPNHATFSDESMYSTPQNPGGHWNGDTFIPPSKQAQPKSLYDQWQEEKENTNSQPMPKLSMLPAHQVKLGNQSLVGNNPLVASSTNVDPNLAFQDQHKTEHQLQAAGGAALSDATLGLVNLAKEQQAKYPSAAGAGSLVGSVLPFMAAEKGLSLIPKATSLLKVVEEGPALLRARQAVVRGATLGTVLGTARQGISAAKGEGFSPSEIAKEAGMFAGYDLAGNLILKPIIGSVTGSQSPSPAEAMAAKVGAKYDGIQEMPNGKPPYHTFTDDVTKTTVIVKNIDDLPAKLEAKRAEFAKSQNVTNPQQPPTTTEVPSQNELQLRNAGVNPLTVLSDATTQLMSKLGPPKEVAAGLDKGLDAIIQHHENIREPEYLTKLYETKVNEMVPDPARQQMIIDAVEHDRAPKYWDKLNGTEKKVANWAISEGDKQEAFIKQHDVLDVPNREPGSRYVFHWWENPETGEPYSSMYGKLSKSLPQAKERTIPTYEEGIANGMKPVTTNIGRLLGESLQSITRAQQTRQMAETLSRIPTDVVGKTKGGNPTKMRLIESLDRVRQNKAGSDYVERGVGDGYRFLEKGVYLGENAEGKPIITKERVAVHKELAPFLDAYVKSPTYGNGFRLVFAAKSLKLGLSFFHHVSLGMQELANGRIPFKNISRGLDLIRGGDETMRLLHKSGLELKGYEDINYNDLGWKGSNPVGKAWNVLTTPMKLGNKFLFERVQPGMKASFAYDEFNRMYEAYKDKPGWTKERIAREAVKAADSFFSGEDYKRAMLETNKFMAKYYFSATGRKVAQATFISPTWQREHLIAFKQVAKLAVPDAKLEQMGLTPLGPARVTYGRYLAGALTMYATANMLNWMWTKKMDGEGRFLFQNPEDKGYAVRAPFNNPSYYNAEVKDGQKIVSSKRFDSQDEATAWLKGKLAGTQYAGGIDPVPETPAYFRPLKSIFEIPEFSTNPVEKFAGKVNPIIAATAEQFFGDQNQYKSGWAGMPARAKKFLYETGTPMSFDQIVNTSQLKQPLPAAVMSFFGMPSSGMKEADMRKAFVEAYKAAPDDKTKRALVEQFKLKYAALLNNKAGAK